ncbi:polysaccharide biosynthesis/export family protein [Agarivorans gilvus]|uniref:polysaccharide biosynthesis/export family protein n=1 Tax=Agarivorans gilvus TaxID=680279 RepID=UPI0006EC2AAD|nr:polysaccharide biosynthesis/export family protein [Agarivorans gilvus]
MKLKLLYTVRTLAFVTLTFIGSLSSQAAPDISPEQMQMLQKLPPEQQKALAIEYGISLNQIDQSEISGTFPEAVLPEKRNQQTVLSSDYLELRKQLELQKLEDEKAKEDELKRFGLGVFSTKPNTFAPISNLPVTSDYILGPGDTILVQLFGKENQSLQFKVNRQGTILFPELGPISVAGQSFLSVKNAITERIAEQKIGVRAAVSMGELRSIEVFVSGDSYQPGKYLVSSLATITHALYASGGVSESGSLRDIRLLRNGKIVKHLDLYDLLIFGNSANDVRLQAGDVVFVSPLGQQLKLKGKLFGLLFMKLKATRQSAT